MHIHVVVDSVNIPQTGISVIARRELPLLPNLQTLVKHVGAKAQDQFENIGLGLNLTKPELNAIKSECNNNSKSCFIEIFQKWEQNTTPPYTWMTIIEILESDLVQRKDLALELRRKCAMTHPG